MRDDGCKRELEINLSLSCLSRQDFLYVLWLRDPISQRHPFTASQFLLRIGLRCVVDDNKFTILCVQKKNWLVVFSGISHSLSKVAKLMYKLPCH